MSVRNSTFLSPTLAPRPIEHRPRRLAAPAAEWPTYMTPSELSQRVYLGVPADTINKTANKYKIGKRMGRNRVLGPADAVLLYEVLPSSCHSSSLNAPNRPSGSCAAPSAESALKKALELTRGASRRK